MRQFILILCVATISLFSCTSNDNSIDQKDSLINPPEWIQESWYSVDGVSEHDGWRFTEDDFIILQAGIEISQKLQIEGYKNAGLNVEVVEEIEEDWYSITQHLPMGQSTTYSFEKKSNTVIIWVQAAAPYKKK